MDEGAKVMDDSMEGVEETGNVNEDTKVMDDSMFGNDMPEGNCDTFITKGSGTQMSLLGSPEVSSLSGAVLLGPRTSSPSLVSTRPVSTGAGIALSSINIMSGAFATGTTLRRRFSGM